MNNIKFIWDFFKSLPAVFAGIVIFISGVKHTFLFIRDNLILSLIFFVCLFFLILWLFKFFRKNIADFLDRKSSLEIDNKIKKITKKRNLSFEKVLPDQKLIKKMGDESIKKGKSWAEDAILNSFNLYIDIRSNTKNSIRSQAYFTSKWKNAVLTIYEGSLNTDGLEELDSSHVKWMDSAKPFYEKFPNWRKVVIKSYEAVKDSLTEEFEVKIHSFAGSMSIGYHFKNGKMEKQKSFEFNGKELKNESNSQIIKIV